ncbi:MAG: RNA polymerase sigma factor [Candidatus Zophobacter franzmannii]|jgi:RNA polymerase sigma-70 factor (ECF subfamily)|nr:RNA polymerase sigma factor [Candidatus Zophobacter franzmannii]
MNKDLFEEVVRTNQNRIYNYLLKFVRQREDAEDLTQSVFLSFYFKMSDVEDGRELSYLYRAAHNQAINHLKKSKKTSSAPDFLLENLNAPEEENYMHQEIVKLAVKQLPAKLAVVIELQYYEGLRYKKIAEQLGCSVKAVESKLVRAKKQLRKIIEREISFSDVLVNKEFVK